MGNFCEHYGLPLIAPSRQKGKKPNDFHVKKKNVSEKNKQLGKFKNKFNILKIDNKNKKELFKILESNNSSDSLQKH